jgi:phosphohistidine phosphatase
MLLYLVQHGKSLPKEVDPDQGLTEQGRIEVQQMAIKAREMGISVSRIIHSGKKRALQTAETLSAHLTPGRKPDAYEGLNPTDDVAAFALTLSGSEDLMVVGHLPFMERLAALLIAGSPDKSVIRFRNSGIVCLKFEKERLSWVILWALVPEMA